LVGGRVGPRPPSLLAGAVGGELTIAAAALWFSLTMSPPPLDRSRARFGLLLALTPAALFAWKVSWSARYPDMLAAWPGRIGLRCLALTLAMGRPLLVTLASLRRDSEPLYAGSLGDALGIAVGAAAAPLDLWCPVAHPQHVLIGHIAPSLLLAATGALLGRYVMEMRAPGARR
jgi:negative regulator of sigma F NrsF-like protein